MTFEPADFPHSSVFTFGGGKPSSVYCEWAASQAQASCSAALSGGHLPDILIAVAHSRCLLQSRLEREWAAKP